MKGFTLMELILVVAIMLVLAGSSGVFYSRFLLQNAVSNTEDQLAGSLRKAQIYSMMGKGNNSWGVSYNATSITLFLTGNTAYNEVFNLNPQVMLNPPSQSITFAKATGLPNTAITVIISANNTTRTLSVNMQGVINK